MLVRRGSVYVSPLRGSPYWPMVPRPYGLGCSLPPALAGCVPPHTESTSELIATRLDGMQAASCLRHSGVMNPATQR
jgi:hypothetical protein